MSGIRTIEANGIATAFRLEGPADAPVVMLCHGMMGSIALWDRQVAPLAERYRVLCYDNRGHGRTEVTPPPYAMATLVADARALLDALGIDRVHFVGASLGGMIGQLLAVTHPERVRSLAVLGTLAVMGPPAMWDRRFAAIRATGIAAIVPEMLDRWFTPAFRAASPGVMDAFVAELERCPVEGYVGCGSAIRDMDQRGILPGIAAPTLVMGGDEDPGVPVAETEAIWRAIPGAEKVVVPGARHLFMIERADETNRVLRDWFDRH
jgi:3-oxoadipate enol-lactonase